MNQTLDDSEPVAKHRSTELFEQANSEYDSGNFERALDLFDQAIAYGLESEVVYNNKGAALDALGRNEEAVKCYRQATAIKKDYELAWHNLGNSLFIREAFGGAARAYARAAIIRATRMENWTGLAASYTKLGRPKKARNAIEALNRFAEEDPSILLLQSDMYLDAGFSELSMRCCREYISRRPHAVEGYARLGSTQHETNEYGKAIETFEQALKIDPTNKELWNNLGYTCFCAGFLEKAIQCFDKAIELDPTYKHAWYNKGYAYHGADLLEDAVRCYSKAIEIDPVDRVLWNNIGNALYNLGKYAESIPRFVEAIKIDPDYEIAWNNIGNALEKMGLYGQAIPFHDRSLEISPDFDYALYAKGVCRSWTGDPESGYDLVLESLDLNPTYDEAWKARSKIAGQLGRWDEALISIEEALAINPEFDQGWTERGEILLAVGDAEAAQASFEMALRCLESVRPDTVGGVQALVRRGEVLTRLGRYEEALANLESVAISGKLDLASIPRTLELRRFLNRWELPSSLKAAAERSPESKVKLAYASFLLDAGDWTGADKALAQIDAGREGPLHRFLQAKAKALTGDQNAVEKLIRVLKDNGTKVLAERLEGEILEAKGSLKSAAVSFSKALDLDPSDRATAMGLARVRLLAGDAKGAIEAADLAIGIDDKDWEPYRIKGEAFKAMGEEEKSNAEVAKARKLLLVSGFDSESVGGGSS